MAKTPGSAEMSPEQFTLKAIVRLRKPQYKGIHTVYSGFNAAFREYYPLLDPVDFTNQLAKDGKIIIRPIKGGVKLYKSEDASGATPTSNTIKKIVG